MPIINMVYKAPRVWKPNANTLLYLPLENDTIDHSWKWTAITVSWTPTKADIWYWFSGWTYLRTNFSENLFVGSMPYTILMWAKWASWTSWLTNYSPLYSTTYYSGGAYSWSEARLWGSNVFYTSWYWSEQALTLDWSDSTQWNLMAFVLNSTSQNIYQNSQLIWQGTANYRMSTSNYLNFPSNTSDSWRNKWVWLSKIIIENKARTADEVSKYYNSTKSLYWIS